MKNIFLIAIAIITLGVFSCSKETVEEPEIKTAYTDIPIPNKYISQSCDSECEITETDIIVTTADGKQIEGKIRITSPIDAPDYLIQFELSSNIVQEATIDPNSWVENDNSPHRIKSSCIASCQEKFTDKEGNKIKGRGRCKAGCWAKTAAQVLTAVSAIVVATK